MLSVNMTKLEMDDLYAFEIGSKGSSPLLLVLVLKFFHTIHKAISSSKIKYLNYSGK